MMIVAVALRFLVLPVPVPGKTVVPTVKGMRSAGFWHVGITVMNGFNGFKGGNLDNFTRLRVNY